MQIYAIFLDVTNIKTEINNIFNNKIAEEAL